MPPAGALIHSLQSFPEISQHIVRWFFSTVRPRTSLSLYLTIVLQPSKACIECVLRDKPCVFMGWPLCCNTCHNEGLSNCSYTRILTFMSDIPVLAPHPTPFDFPKSTYSSRTSSSSSSRLTLLVEFEKFRELWSYLGEFPLESELFYDVDADGFPTKLNDYLQDVRQLVRSENTMRFGARQLAIQDRFSAAWWFAYSADISRQNIARARASAAAALLNSYIPDSDDGDYPSTAELYEEWGWDGES